MCSGQTPYLYDKYNKTNPITPVQCVSSCPHTNQFYIKTDNGPTCVKQCPDNSAVGRGDMYECVSNCGENYLYSIKHPTSSTIVCVQQCPASSPLLKSEVFNQTYPISCVTNCKSEGKYLYRDGSYSYCVDDCSVYGQYHSAMSSAQEARCVSQCQYLTLRNNKIYCIDVCNYIVEYDEVEGQFCLDKCDALVFSGSDVLPHCVTRCPIGYHVEGNACKLIEGCENGFFSASNECQSSCPSGYFQFQNDVRVCVSSCVGYIQPYINSEMKECVVGKQCTDRKAPFYSQQKKECVDACERYLMESSHNCIYNCPQRYYKIVGDHRVCASRCAAPLSVAIPSGDYTLCKAPCDHMLPSGECGTTCGDYYEYGDLCVERCPNGFPYAKVYNQTVTSQATGDGSATSTTTVKRVCVASCKKFVVEDDSSTQRLFCAETCDTDHYQRNVSGQIYCVESCENDFMFY